MTVPPDPETIRRARKWVLDLVELTEPAGGRRATRAQVEAYARQLAADLPRAAFSPASLAAMRFNTWPPAVVLSDRLGAWWQANQPRHAVQAAQDSAYNRLPSEMQIWIDYWHTRTAEGLTDEQREHVASLVRTQSPDAWRHITRAAQEPPPAEAMPWNL